MIERESQEQPEPNLQLIPWYWGILWTSLERDPESTEVHLLVPAVFALVSLARRQPEEYRRLLRHEYVLAREHYGSRIELDKELGKHPLALKKAQRMELLLKLCPELGAVLSWARRFETEWTAQNGISAQVLDSLADAVKRFREAQTAWDGA